MLIILILVFVFFILIAVLINLRINLETRRRLEEDLLKQHDLSSAIVNSMGEGVLVLDAEFKIKLINPAAEELLETTSNEAVGQQWVKFVKAYEEDKEIPFTRRWAVTSFQTKMVRVTHITDNHYYETRSGHRYPIVSVTTPLFQNGLPVGILKVFRDATPDKDVDRMKNEFISLVSHQLRTPLVSIKWYCELLEDKKFGGLTEKQQEFSKNIADSLTRMIDLVNSLLNISRIESGRLMIDPKKTNLANFVRSVVTELQKKAIDRHQTLTVSVTPDIPEVMVDPNLIRHVYLNLIDNAIKYGREGGNVVVSITQKDGEVISKITDNGVGIPEGEQSKIFQRFFRGSNVKRKFMEGTGLGLYLVKAVVESSGGKIWLSSRESEGTTFWFSLPIAGVTPKPGNVTLEK